METIISFVLILLVAVATLRNNPVASSKSYRQLPDFVSLKNEKRLLYYYYFQHSQKNVTEVLEKFARMRDFYNQVNRLHTLIIIGDLVAKGSNATLVFRKFEFLNDTDFKLSYPTILPFLGTLLGKERTPLFLRGNYQSQLSNNFKVAMPLFAQIDSFQFNIVYCDVPKTEKLTALQALSIFINPFDNYTWFGVFISFFLVSVTIYLSGLLNNQKDFSTAMLIAFASLLSPIMGNTSLNDKLKSSSVIFIIWLFCCVVLINSYAGLMSSVIIIPISDDVIRNLDELLTMGYRLVYPLPNWVASDTNLAKKSNITALAKLLEKPIMEKDYIKELIIHDKRAFFSIWQIAMGVAFSAKELLKQQQEKFGANSINQKECYVGGEVLQTGEMYYGFLPPSSNKYAYRAFQRIFDAGIYRYWMNEYSALSHSKRVQDRVKVKSSTQLFRERQQTIKPLDLGGKINTIFGIWGVGILVSAVLFTKEVLIDRPLCGFYKIGHKRTVVINIEYLYSLNIR